MKIVVFDLDETMGYFTEFAIFWDSLNKYFYFLQKNNEDTDTDKIVLTSDDFDYALDLYPEFLRPEIINILDYLKNKKQSKCCGKMMIYTNNQGPEKWAYLIKNYFEGKINYDLFDRIIRAFRLNGKVFEVCRTETDKTYKDLIRCTKLPPHAEICFLDDNVYPEMVNDKVYYINIKPYTYNLTYNQMLDRFLESELADEIVKDENHFRKEMKKYMEQYHFTYVEKDPDEQEIDVIISKDILNHLDKFFDSSLNKEETHNKSNKNRVNKKTHKKK